MSPEFGIAIILALFPFGWDMLGLPQVRTVGVISWAACLAIVAHLVLRSPWFTHRFAQYPRSISAVLGSLGTLTVTCLVAVVFWLGSTGRPSNGGQRTITLSAYQPVYPLPMLVVKDQKFEDQDVPLDGFTYDHDTFTNVCFRYDGQAYQLLNSTLRKGGRVCVDDQRLKNLMELMSALQLLGANSVSQGATVPTR